MSASRRDLEKNRQQQPQSEAENQNSDEQGIRINGFAQVVAMLEVADPQFRESLLRRLAQRDPRLARNLRDDLG
jgi:hypothetical protein